jgi:hypothetical protein
MERFAALRLTSGSDDAMVIAGGPMFACHKGEPGTNADVACAGWLAVCSDYHLGVRLAIIRGELNPAAMEPAENWPALFGSYDEMAAAQGASHSIE